jgi:hypothetical protein
MASRFKVVALLVLSLLVFSSTGAALLSASAASNTGTVSQTSSGLVHSDDLTSGVPSCTGGYNDTSSIDTSYWTISGDAKRESGSSWTACEGPSGLWLGVQSGGPSGTWAGIYAESTTETVMLYHTNLMLPMYSISTIQSGSFNTGLYVQTSNGMVNYLTCYGQVTAGDGYYWGVELATGNTDGATSYQELWTGPSYTNTGPSDEACTIVTNGSNLLQVYMNGTMVYSNTSDNLNIPEPFNAYLEVETSDSQQMLWAGYTDFYATTSNDVTIQNVPAGDVAEIVSGSTVYASATNSGSSPAAVSLNIAQYDLPLAGSLEILSGGSVVATTGSTSFWAGDAYSYQPGTTTTTSTSSSTTKTTQTSTSTSTSTIPGAIALNDVQSTSATVSSSPYQVTIAGFNAGTGSNRLLVVGVSANDEGVASITFGGAPLTQAVASFYNNDAEFWYLVNPAVTGNVVVTFAGATSAVVGAYAFSGVDQATPIPTTNSAYNTAASSPTISLTTQYPNSWVIDLPSIWGGVTLSSPSCTQRWDVNVSDEITGASSSTAQGTPGKATCGWTASNGGDYWDDVAVEIAAASAGTTSTTTSSTTTTTLSTTTQTSTTTASSTTTQTSTTTTTSTTTSCLPIVGCL